VAAIRGGPARWALDPQPASEGRDAVAQAEQGASVGAGAVGSVVADVDVQHALVDFKESIIQAFADGIAHKPETALGNVKADVLAEKLPGYERPNFLRAHSGLAAQQLGRTAREPLPGDRHLRSIRRRGARTVS
jgi:hypothetical protein